MAIMTPPLSSSTMGPVLQETRHECRVMHYALKALFLSVVTCSMRRKPCYCVDSMKCNTTLCF